MRLRTLLLLLVSVLGLIPHPMWAQGTTPTEARAVAAAAQDPHPYTLPPDKLAKAEKLGPIGTGIYFGGTLWTLLTLFLILEWRVAARMRNVAVNLSKKRWVQGFVFLLEFLLLTALLQLPFTLYRRHLSLAYGFSVQGWGSWFLDQIKGFLLEWIIGGLLVMLLFFVIRRFPRRWWLVLWFPVMALVLFAVYVSPIVIDPLFNKFEPLGRTDPALVEKLERVVARAPGIDIPPERMFLMKASAKTTTINAYVTGFGSSKRLVLWDTIIAKSTPDELALIFGHEMGHYVLGHIVRGILFAFSLILLSFFLGFLLFQALLRRFGQRWRVPSQNDWAALIVFVFVLTLIGFFTAPIANSFIRHQEHNADIFGQEAVHGIVADPEVTGQQAFQVLGENYLEDPAPTEFVEFWTFSHPSITHRAGFARHYDPWAPGEAPKYFKK